MTPGQLRADGGAPPVEAARWRQAAELGLFCLGLPPEIGGAGGTCTDEVVAFHQMGRSLAPLSFAATLLAAHAAYAAGSDLVGRLIEGNFCAGLGAEEYAGSLEISAKAVTGDAVLFRTRDTDVILVTAGSRFAAIAPEELPELAWRPGLDASADVTTVRLNSVPALFDGDSPAVVQRGRLLVAAMMAGVAELSTEMSVSYTSDRRQFDRSLASFQVIKHRCADMATRAESALATVFYGAVLLDENDVTGWVVALAAKHMAAEAALENARDNIQNHGGIGFTFEYDAHLLLRRAHLLEEIFGARTENLRLILAARSPLAED